MIVNPQLFNYRLIIGSLVTVIVVLGAYSYNSFISLKDQEAFIKQENHLVQNELSQMIDSYKTVNGKNDRVTYKLEDVNDKLNRIMDSVKALPESKSLITHYEAKIKAAKQSNASVLTLLNVYKAENAVLKELLLENIVKPKKTMASTIPAVLEQKPIDKALLDGAIKNVSPSLSNTSILMNNVIEIEDTESTINIRNIRVEGVKRVTPKKRIVSTKTASKANQLHVSFTIPKSELSDPNKKNIYIQIVDPNNNVVGDKGSVNFGNRNLIYSKKTTIHQDKENVKFSTLIDTNRKEPLIKGEYLVNIFHNSILIADTTLNLK